jgi:hypothetical protein
VFNEPCYKIHDRYTESRIWLHKCEIISKHEVLGRTNHLLSSESTWTSYKTRGPTILLLLRVFVAAASFLPSRCLATIGRHTYSHTGSYEGFMKYAAEMGLRCHDINTEFHKDWLRHSKSDKGETQTHRQQGDLISLLQIFRNESRLNNAPVIYHHTTLYTVIDIVNIA